MIKTLLTEVNKLSRIQLNENESMRRKRQICNRFLENVKEIVFYSVPHSTYREQVFQNYITRCSETGHLLRRSSLLQNITRNTKQFSQEMVKLSIEFESKLGYRTMILAFYEEQPTNMVSILDIFEETFCSATRNLPTKTCAQFDQRQLSQSSLL